MDKFEYKTFVYDTKGIWGGNVEESKFLEQLNAFGDDGWELVNSFATAQSYGSTKCIVCVFKRKKA